MSEGTRIESRSPSRSILRFSGPPASKVDRTFDSVLECKRKSKAKVAIAIVKNNAVLSRISAMAMCLF